MVGGRKPGSVLIRFYQGQGDGTPGRRLVLFLVCRCLALTRRPASIPAPQLDPNPRTSAFAPSLAALSLPAEAFAWGVPAQPARSPGCQRRGSQARSADG